jgi:predicted RNase H-like HicB family nuclease
MRYPVVIHHDQGSAFGVTVPDIPGCFSAGDTFEEALDNTLEAIELHLEGLADMGELVPKPSTVDDHKDNPDYAGGTWGFVYINVIPFLGKSEKINVTLPSIVIHRIDAKHKNRSKFLTEAALKLLG